MEYLPPADAPMDTPVRGRRAPRKPGLKASEKTQLELDRRIVRRKISRLKEDLARIERGRKVAAATGRRIKSLSSVTRTPASRPSSTLWAGSAFVEDRLFATLDPAVRRCETDAGDRFYHRHGRFLRKLPVDLVASFRSTLEETVYADLLVHVVDISHAVTAASDGHDLGGARGSRASGASRCWSSSTSAMRLRASPGRGPRARDARGSFAISARSVRASTSARAIERRSGHRGHGARPRLRGRGDLVGKIHLLVNSGPLEEGDEIIYTLRATCALGRILGMAGVEELVA